MRAKFARWKQPEFLCNTVRGTGGQFMAKAYGWPTVLRSRIASSQKTGVAPCHGRHERFRSATLLGQLSVEQTFAAHQKYVAFTPKVRGAANA